MNGKIKLVLLIALVVTAGVTYFNFRYPNNVPVVYEDPVDHFKYGSIGADIDNGLPTRIMEVMPEVFADLLPPGAPRDWTACQRTPEFSTITHDLGAARDALGHDLDALDRREIVGGVDRPGHDLVDGHGREHGVLFVEAGEFEQVVDDVLGTLGLALE